MNYLRKVTAFAVDPSERYLYAANLAGQILSVNVDEFTVHGEVRAHAASIESVAIHPTLPYLATLGIDYTVMLWDCSDPRRLRKLQSIHLRDIRSEGYEFITTLPLSCPLAFHPRERKLITHNADGALTEIEFDDTKHRPLWAEGHFREPDGSSYDMDYVRYLVGSEHIFASTFGGHVAIVDPKAPREPLLRWRYNQRTIHCAEHIEGTDYLLASDTRRIIRFDVSGKKAPLVGPPVMRDHIEQISINRATGRVLATGFDRTVVEIDPTNCELKGTVLKTPFKLRWLHNFERAPDWVAVQCRNGALYKASLSGKQRTAVIKETPNAVWTGTRLNSRELAFAGEGPEMLRVKMEAAPHQALETKFSSQWETLPVDPGSYAKRMVFHEPTQALVQGRSDGEIVVIRGGVTRSLIRLPAALRDIAVSPEGFDLFAIAENARAYRIDLESGRILAEFFRSEEPLWSLAYNHELRILAVCERQGQLSLLNADDLSLQLSVADTWAPKRMLWRDSERLLIGRGAALYELNVATGAMENVVPHLGNTIEDFGWDDERRFLVTCTYARRIHLFDFKTFRELSVTGFDLDFPKGMAWLPADRAEGVHPYEFLVFGRSGVLRRYWVHDERLHSMGPVDAPLSAAIHDDTGVRVP
jgi:WD40 repeat protein